jgi:hypothetical protein
MTARATHHKTVRRGWQGSHDKKSQYAEYHQVKQLVLSGEQHRRINSGLAGEIKYQDCPCNSSQQQGGTDRATWHESQEASRWCQTQAERMMSSMFS